MSLSTHPKLRGSVVSGACQQVETKREMGRGERRMSSLCLCGRSRHAHLLPTSKRHSTSGARCSMLDLRGPAHDPRFAGRI